MRRTGLTLWLVVSLVSCGRCSFCGSSGGGGGGGGLGGGGSTGTGRPWWCALTGCADAGPTGCNPTTCAGCCDVAGRCQSGTSVVSCGIAGRTCFGCLPGQECRAGGCVSTPMEFCGAATCGGCCADARTCVPGTLDDECGSGGTPCRFCGTGLRCINSQCVRPSTPDCQVSCAGCCQPPSGFQTEPTCTAPSRQACGANGAACVACAEGFDCIDGRCHSSSRCSCLAGQCCRNGACEQTNEQTCAIGGSPSSECRLCGSTERCGAGTDEGWCVSPGSVPRFASCTWDGDCRPGTSGVVACVRTPNQAFGFCSDPCSTSACADGGVCVPLSATRRMCFEACRQPGATCSNPAFVCERSSAPGGLVCVTKCTPETVMTLCPSGRCAADGRCCGESGLACCAEPTPCSGPSASGGTSTCLAGTCS